MSRSQFQSKIFILRHAWLNLWDERMTTGRINQVANHVTTHKLANVSWQANATTAPASCGQGWPFTPAERRWTEPPRCNFHAPLRWSSFKLLFKPDRRTAIQWQLKLDHRPRNTFICQMACSNHHCPQRRNVDDNLAELMDLWWQDAQFTFPVEQLLITGKCITGQLDFDLPLCITQ